MQIKKLYASLVPRPSHHPPGNEASNVLRVIAGRRTESYYLDPFFFSAGREARRGKETP